MSQVGFPASTGFWFWNEVHHDNSPRRQRQGLLHSIKLILGTFLFFSFNAIRTTWKGGNEIIGHISKTRGMKEHFHWYGGLRRNEYIMRSWDFSHVNSPSGVQEQNHPSATSDYPPHLLCSSFLHGLSAPSSSIVLIQASLHPFLIFPSCTIVLSRRFLNPLFLAPAHSCLIFTKSSLHPYILPSSSHPVWIQRGPLHLQICRNLIIHNEFQCWTGSWSAGLHVRVKNHLEQWGEPLVLSGLSQRQSSDWQPLTAARRTRTENQYRLCHCASRLDSSGGRCSLRFKFLFCIF